MDEPLSYLRLSSGVKNLRGRAPASRLGRSGLTWEMSAGRLDEAAKVHEEILRRIRGHTLSHYDQDVTASIEGNPDVPDRYPYLLVFFRRIDIDISGEAVRLRVLEGLSVAIVLQEYGFVLRVVEIRRCRKAWPRKIGDLDRVAIFAHHHLDVRRRVWR